MRQYSGRLTESAAQSHRMTQQIGPLLKDKRQYKNLLCGRQRVLAFGI